MEMKLKTGKYKHFKGKEYELLYIAKHSETLEEFVVYKALYGDFGIWIRPAKMWEELVVHEGRELKRFTYVGDE